MLVENKTKQNPRRISGDQYENSYTPAQTLSHMGG